jgi:hypothetical protein
MLGEQRLRGSRTHIFNITLHRCSTCNLNAMICIIERFSDRSTGFTPSTMQQADSCCIYKYRETCLHPSHLNAVEPY